MAITYEFVQVLPSLHSAIPIDKQKKKGTHSPFVVTANSIKIYDQLIKVKKKYAKLTFMTKD